MHKQNFRKMNLKRIVFGLLIVLIIFESCSDNSDENICCELKIKIIDNLDNNLLETRFYNSDTIFLFQDNIETKSYFDIDSVANILSLSTRILDTYNMNNEFILYLNQLDTDTLKIEYENDPNIQCLGGLKLKFLKHNGQLVEKHNDVYFIMK